MSPTSFLSFFSLCFKKFSPESYFQPDVRVLPATTDFNMVGSLSKTSLFAWSARNCAPLNKNAPSPPICWRSHIFVLTDHIKPLPSSNHKLHTQWVTHIYYSFNFKSKITPPHGRQPDTSLGRVGQDSSLLSSSGATASGAARAAGTQGEDGLKMWWRRGQEEMLGDP